MNTRKGRSATQELSALQEGALEELFAIPDEVLLKEVLEDGIDPTTLANMLRTNVNETLVEARRERLDQARLRLKSSQATKKVEMRNRPSIERMKQLIQDVFVRDTSLGLAYRDGQQQSEADWQSLWDDLVELDVLREDDGSDRP